MSNHLKSILLFPFNVLYHFNPVLCTKWLFFLKLGEKLDLNKPRTFNQKLQWIKLYDRDPLKAECVDKYTVRNYIRRAGCEELLNDLIWEGFDPEDIPFEKLPDRCVIKVTHGQGMNIICKDIHELDIQGTVRILRKWLREKYLPCYGEWFYGQVRPRIIIEKFLGDKTGNEPTDFKVFCFHGEPKLIDVHTDRFKGHKRNFYDLEWNVIKGVGIKYPTDDNAVLPKPKELDKLLEYASILSRPFIHVRVDFYIVEGTIYFGELTFTNGAGFDKVTPREFDLQLGGWITLPGKGESLR